jgi:hypothetical protein
VRATSSDAATALVRNPVVSVALFPPCLDIALGHFSEGTKIIADLAADDLRHDAARQRSARRLTALGQGRSPPKANEQRQ